MKVTLQKISDILGFSITIVSRALAGYSDVSEKTHVKIQNIADELNYIPNQIARSLQSRNFQIVVSVHDDIGRDASALSK